MTAARDLRPGDLIAWGEVRYPPVLLLHGDVAVEVLSTTQTVVLPSADFEVEVMTLCSGCGHPIVAGEDCPRYGYGERHAL